MREKQPQLLGETGGYKGIILRIVVNVIELRRRLPGGLRL